MDYYKRWNEEECVRSFAEKGIGDFFQSETKLLPSILGNISSVLDVGCASGRYIELLLSLRPELCASLDFHGIDTSEESIANARRIYPQYHFRTINALDYAPGRMFDLVNATGVCQHEPRFEMLIKRMVDWSTNYVMFDVKFAAIEEHIIDRGSSFAGSADNRLYFILLSYPRMIDFLRSLEEVGAIRIFGYETPVNKRTTVPQGISSVISAGILLRKGVAPSGPDVEAELPLARLRSNNSV